VYVSGLSVWSVGNAAAVSLVFIFLADYLQLGASVTPLMITYFVIQMIAMPLWVRLLPYIDKHRLIAICWLLDAALKPALLWLEPGAVNLVFLYTVLVCSAVLNSISYTFPQAILADVVDFDTLKTRKERAASYFALNTLLYKIMMGVGAGIALPLLAAFGYTVGHAHDALARTGMMVGIVAFPALCLTSAAAIMWRFPIGSRRQQVIAARLAARERRLAPA
jgi:Na+/melibiose symporter-like transporter